MDSYRDYKLWYLLQQVVDALYKARDKELSRYGITVTQSEILYFINDLDSRATLAEIARCMSRHPHTISPQVQKLELSGLIEKNSPGLDKQPLIYKLTENGVIAYEQTLKYESIHKAMSSLTMLDRSHLESFLTKVWENSVSQLR